MSKHVSLREQVDNLLNNIKSLVDKNNVSSMIKLFSWIIKKMNLIVSSELKKQKIKECKSKNIRPPQILKCSRGEIWECYLGFNIGSEQNGVNEKFSRPVLIIQNDDNNKKSPNTIIAPLSKIENRMNENGEISNDEIEKIKNALRGTEILLLKDDVKSGEPSLLHPSIVLCQNIREISKERLDYKITHIKDECWEELNSAIKYSLGIDR